MKKISEQISFEKAFTELEEIALLIEKDKISVDKLPDAIKRASELLNYCRKKLRESEDEIAQLSKENSSEKN
jgi:exodeoxyribonuclease VII small subunit